MTDTENLSKIALIGATGGMGRKVLDELVRRDVPVRALIRRPGVLSQNGRVEPILVDVFDTAALTTALQGAATVISAFNPGWDSPDLYQRYVKGARSITSATVGAGAGRMLVVGGAASLVGDDGLELIEHGLPPEPYGSGVRAARDLLHELREEKEPDWVFLSPPMECGPIGPTGRTGRYRIGKDHPVLDDAGRNSLSVEDLAVAIVDEALNPRFHHDRFTVGY